MLPIVGQYDGRYMKQSSLLKNMAASKTVQIGGHDENFDQISTLIFSFLLNAFRKHYKT